MNNQRLHHANAFISAHNEITGIPLINIPHMLSNPQDRIMGEIMSRNQYRVLAVFFRD
jgi:hypothetical protein